MTDYSKLYPKTRTGQECKKTKCKRHKDYLAWNYGNRNLKYCMECKNAHVSQYKKKEGK